MRSRNIKPGFWENEKIGQLPHTQRLLFIGLWCLADRDGKLEDRPDRIQHLLFGYDKKPIDIEKALCNLMSLHFITRYTIDQHRYISIPTFKNHQSPHPHEARSKIPDYQQGREMSLQVTKCHSDSLIPDIRNPDIRNNGKYPFEAFYKIYPKKTAKQKAIESWNKIKMTQELFDGILRAVEDQKKSDQWTRDGGQYIPHPATWLNGQRWLDEGFSRAPTPEDEAEKKRKWEAADQRLKAVALNALKTLGGPK